MLKIARRRCKIGSSINTRAQGAGDSDVSALDIPIKDIAINSEELPEVMLETKAYNLLYKKHKNRPDEPIWGKLLNPFVFQEKVDGVNVSLYLGKRIMKLNDITLAKLIVEPQEGGTTLLSFTIQCVPDLDESIEELLSKLNQKIDIAFTCENYGAQPELPLEEPGEIQEDFVDGPLDDAEPLVGGKRGRGRGKGNLGAVE